MVQKLWSYTVFFLNQVCWHVTHFVKTIYSCVMLSTYHQGSKDTQHTHTMPLGCTIADWRLSAIAMGWRISVIALGWRLSVIARARGVVSLHWAGGLVSLHWARGLVSLHWAWGLVSLHWAGSVVSLHWARGLMPLHWARGLVSLHWARGLVPLHWARHVVTLQLEQVTLRRLSAIAQGWKLSGITLLSTPVPMSHESPFHFFVDLLLFLLYTHTVGLFSGHLTFLHHLVLLASSKHPTPAVVQG